MDGWMDLPTINQLPPLLPPHGHCRCSCTELNPTKYLLLLPPPQISVFDLHPPSLQRDLRDLVS